MPRRSRCPGAALVTTVVLLGVVSLAGCGPDVETCDDQLTLTFDEEVARDYVLVLTVGDDTARVDCSLATHPTEGGANPVDLDVAIAGTLEGQARCTVGSIVLRGVTPDDGSLALTYRLPGAAEEAFDLVETEFSVAYEEVEAEDRTCRQAELTVDVGCLQGTECGGAENDSE